MHIVPESLASVEEPDNALVLRRLVTRDDHGPNVSVTWVRIAGRHHRLSTDHGDRVYVVLDGEGDFIVGETPYPGVRAGEVVHIPRGTPYELEGDMTYLVITAPAQPRGGNVYYDGPRAARSSQDDRP